MKGNENLKLAGYAALVKRYNIEVIPNWHSSYVAASGSHQVIETADGIEEVFPSKYWHGDEPGDHFEFALKYDGVNLAILSRLFDVMPESHILDYVKSMPTGKFARRLWFLYEFLTEKTLPLDDVKQGNYCDLLDPGKYYAATPARQARRQRINDNLPGNNRFCPLIRRTAVLGDFESADLPGRCRKVVSASSPSLLKRALGYLYARETKSSFEIERITPASSRIERFVALLQLAETKDFCDKDHFIELQNQIVDPRFRASDYRTTQNYIGETIAPMGERVHFICPAPHDLPDLMQGLVDAHKSLENGNLPAVIHATVIAYGFVFLHPFEDGNGRIHRFLIHNILARRHFTPEGVMFPVSSSMLNNTDDYDRSLEAFSRSLMPLVDYALDEDGRMTVYNDTAPWYRYMDLTNQAEALFRFIERTIDTELTSELAFLSCYDKTRKAMREIVDMPDLKADLFIRFCLQNSGRLSAQKRASEFPFLSDEEIASMEQTIRNGLGAIY